MSELYIYFSFLFFIFITCITELKIKVQITFLIPCSFFPTPLLYWQQNIIWNFIFDHKHIFHLVEQLKLARLIMECETCWCASFSLLHAVKWSPVQSIFTVFGRHSYPKQLAFGCIIQLGAVVVWTFDLLISSLMCNHRACGRDM